MVWMVPGSEAAAADRISTKPCSLVPGTERGRLKSVEVSLLLAGRALRRPRGRALRIRKPRAPVKDCAGARGFAFYLRLVCISLSPPKAKLLTLGEFREVKLLSRGSPASKRLQVVYLPAGRVWHGQMESAGTRVRKT